jgi:hypothetical protein
MNFKSVHRFRNVSLTDYEATFFDEAFNIALCKAVGLERTLVSRRVENGRVARVSRIAPQREIPAPVAKILGAAKIEYTENIEYEFGSGKATWKTVSSVMTDKVESRGTITFAQRGAEVERLVEGLVNVKMFGLGGVIEGFIVADVEKSYETAAAFTQKWIDAGGKA